MYQLPQTPDELWVAVFLARIDPKNGPAMRPNDAAVFADEARQAFGTRAAFWAAQAPRRDEESDEFPGIY